MGAEELNGYLYLLDFGLAKKYRSSKTLEQIPLVNNKKLTGTARYASIHALEGYEQSRRDDLESLGYVLIYLLKGNLPWQGLIVKTKEEKNKKILEKKKEITSEELTKDFPQQFCEFLDYTKKLEYNDAPDYDMLKNKLLSILNEKGYIWDFIYDWTSDDDLKLRNNVENKENNVNAENNVDANTKNNVRNFMNNFQFLINQNLKEKEGEVFVDQEENDDNKNVYNENKNNENQENNKKPKFISRVGKGHRPRRNFEFNSLEMFKKKREMKRNNVYVDEEHV
jgi:serine/threonine protein kinase